MENKAEVSIDKKYECPICQLILTNPYQIKSCLHNFCKSCIDSFPKLECPLCKSTFSKKQLCQEEKLNSEIKNTRINCTCKKKIFLSDWNDHSANCKQYLGIVENTIKQSVIKDAKQTVNRSTFPCPLCELKNLDRDGLLKHVKKSHKSDHAVCPICACQPWGDPYYVTHLLGHLEKRHKFDYDTTVDYNDDEDEVLKRVLMESLKNN